MNGSLGGEHATRLGTWDWDIDQDLFVADAHFAQLHGVDPANASQTPISVYLDSVHPDDRALVAHGIKQCLEQHTEHAEEYRVLQGDGQVRWVFARRPLPPRAPWSGTAFCRRGPGHHRAQTHRRSPAQPQ